MILILIIINTKKLNRNQADYILRNDALNRYQNISKISFKTTNKKAK